MTTPDQVLQEAYRFAGQPYSFGAEVPLSLDPDGVCPVDCSELVEAACRRAGVSIPDGAYSQWLACQGVTVDDGIATRGALLFYGDGTGTGRDAITHVAFSQGDGTTFEAWKDGLPVGSYSTDGRPWTFAGLIPGVTYTDTDLWEDSMGVVTVRDGEPGAGACVLIAAGQWFGINDGADRAALRDAFGEAEVSRELWDDLTSSIPQGRA